jgi:hypothetical protein
MSAELFNVPPDLTFEETYNLLIKNAEKIGGGMGNGSAAGPGSGFDAHEPMAARMASR